MQYFLHAMYLNLNPQVLNISSPLGKWQEGDVSEKQKLLLKLQKGGYGKCDKQSHKF